MTFRIKALRICILITAAVLFATGGYLFLLVFPPDHESSKESVRLRNSLIATVGSPKDFEWEPSSIPSSFLLETGEVPAWIQSISNLVFSDRPDTASHFEKGIAIARHLKTGKATNRPILSNTVETYRRIMEDGWGYCSDFTQVFNAIAIASDVPVREWGMSFDGYGGDGHAFNEVFDSGLGKWVFIDSYHSFYVQDVQSGTPLSAMEFRQHLRRASSDELPGLEVVPIVQRYFEFKSERDAIAYYRRGADQLFLYGGNNVFSFDANKLVGIMGSVSRGLEQATAILLRVHPRIWLVPSESNEGQVQALAKTRTAFLILLAGALLLSIALIGQLAFHWTQSRSARSLSPGASRQAPGDRGSESVQKV